MLADQIVRTERILLAVLRLLQNRIRSPGCLDVVPVLSKRCARPDPNGGYIAVEQGADPWNSK